MVVIGSRNARQLGIGAWVLRTFGASNCSVKHRAIRFFEEAVELYQAAGGEPIMAHQLIDYIFGKKPGEIRQELGGVGTTLCALAQAAGYSADDEEAREFLRVSSKPREHFQERDKVKSDAGFRDGFTYATASEDLDVKLRSATIHAIA
jgi:hypothetical protein